MKAIVSIIIFDRLFLFGYNSRKRRLVADISFKLTCLMKIAIHTADLDHQRIDGTRVYMHNLLKNFGKISPEDDFYLYHKGDYNRFLAPPDFPNYTFRQPKFPFAWTQTAFACAVWRDKPDILWMPMHNLPLLRRRNMRTVVTIHDLAFKKFPQYFTPKDLRRLNMLADYAIAHADRLIAVSESTKKDILNFYPGRKEETVKVIYHGFDDSLFKKDGCDKKKSNVLSEFGIRNSEFILYVGAIQPRKNLEVLIEAFEKIKKKRKDFKLVFAGQKAWMWQGVMKKIAESPHGKDVIVTGTIPFEDIAELYRNAAVFVFPSLYEGFGIPVLEAFASETPVVLARNSSLTEIGGEAALYFETSDHQSLYESIEEVLGNDVKRIELITKGRERLKAFSWDRCAEETLRWLKD